MHKYNLGKGVGFFTKTRASIRPYKKLEHYCNVPGYS